MAITKIHAIKTTPNKVLDYITDPNKTDGQLLVSGYNCQVMTAFLDFKMTDALGKEVKGNYAKTGGANNKAYHLIQSFSPDDNVTPEQAHEIGKKLANEFLEGKFEHVVSTHIDKGHIHNHIVINAVSFYDYKKLRTQPYKTAAKIRAISDRICSENDLSVIKDNKKLGYSYTEYKARKTNTSWKSEIRKRLNYLLEGALDYEIFKINAAALGVEVNDKGQHIKYKIDGQEKYTRGNKLADTDRFLKDGILEQISVNIKNISYVEEAIKGAAAESKNYEQFVLNMKENYAITIKKERSGNLSYLLDNEDGYAVKERVLNPAFYTDRIEESIKNRKFEFDRYEGTDSIADQYSRTIKPQVSIEDTRIVLSESDILKVTVDGILIDVPTDSGTIGKVFIDNKNVNFIDKTNSYEVYIGPKYDYYFVSENINSDVLESDQLSAKFIKGENLVRAMELANGIKPISIDIDADDIKSMNVKGITITLPDMGIDSLFVDSQYVEFDKLNNSCRINLYENWNYGYRKGSEPEKATQENIKGRSIIEILKGREVNENSSLLKKIRSLERKMSVNDTKALAETLLLLRRENILKASDFDLKIDELKDQCKEIKNTVKVVESKNEQYKEAAKYLLAFNKYLPIKLEYDKQNVLTKKGFYTKNESELLAFEHASKQLDKLGVNSNVDPDKVIELVKQQTNQISELQKDLKKADAKIDEMKKAKEIVQQIVNPNQEEQKKDAKKEREER